MVWINPKFRDQYRPPEPPEDTGRRLATLPRGDDEELRLTLAEFRGHPYAALRLWRRDPQSGGWFPTRKGCSIRINEVEDVIAGLRQVEGLVAGAGQGGRQERPGPRPAAPTGRSSHAPPERPGGPGEASWGRSDERPVYVERRRAQPRPFDGAGLRPPDEGFDEFK